MSQDGCHFFFSSHSLYLCIFFASFNFFFGTVLVRERKKIKQQLWVKKNPYICSYKMMAMYKINSSYLVSRPTSSYIVSSWFLSLYRLLRQYHLHHQYHLYQRFYLYRFILNLLYPGIRLNFSITRIMFSSARIVVSYLYCHVVSCAWLQLMYLYLLPCGTAA